MRLRWHPSPVARLLAAATCALLGCEPPQPLFQGVESAHWLVIEVESDESRELSRAIVWRARANGCSVDPIPGHKDGYRVTLGHTAYCYTGIVAVWRRKHGVTIGCAKPITRDQCVALLTKITREP